MLMLKTLLLTYVLIAAKAGALRVYIRSRFMLIDYVFESIELLLVLINEVLIDMFVEI